ncbi:hypothetical protein F4X88_14870 [Candidatus Poribacteria bacterium]|nr:hypothetical protein [Candidatus Poribacteria bacterium]MYA57570.1 hypothetical protein [Candidatus Poribacteria bacterium]
MKTILFLAILWCAISLPALAELTPEDLDKIRLIVKEEVDPVKRDVAIIQGQLQGIDKRFDDVNKRFDDVNKRFDHANNYTYALIALIVIAVGIPQIIIASRWRKDVQLEKQMQTLTQRLETLEQQRIVP